VKSIWKTSSCRKITITISLVQDGIYNRESNLIVIHITNCSSSVISAEAWRYPCKINAMQICNWRWWMPTICSQWWPNQQNHTQYQIQIYWRIYSWKGNYSYQIERAAGSSRLSSKTYQVTTSQVQVVLNRKERQVKRKVAQIHL
jgi:hypothetical protein